MKILRKPSRAFGARTSSTDVQGENENLRAPSVLAFPQPMYKARMKTFAHLRCSTRCCAAEVFFHWPRVEWIVRSNKASIRFASAAFFFIQNPEASFGFCLKKKPAQFLRWLCSFAGSPSGAGENRTRVQTRKPEAFYMLIL